MTPRLVLVTPPAEEPAHLSEAKNHLRVDTSEDDAMVLRCVQAARRWAEAYTRRAFVQQTWEVFYPGWPSGNALDIPLSPLASVVSVTWRDANNAPQTAPANNYTTDTLSDPGRIVLNPGASWPSAALWHVHPVSVRFVAGYGTAAAVPADIKAAILLLCGHLYENREQTAKPLAVIPFAAEALLAPYIAGWF